MSKKPTAKSKGLSIPDDLYHQALAKAHMERRSFSSFVCGAIERELTERHLTDGGNSPPAPETIDTVETAKLLGLSPLTVQRRGRKAGDPIRLARCRSGRKRPIQYERAKILALKRAAA